MTKFIGDSALDLYQATFDHNPTPSILAKFARKDGNICIRRVDEMGHPNHLLISSELGIHPSRADDLGRIGFFYSAYSNPPFMNVTVSQNSTDFSNVGSTEAREQTGKLLEPYFKQFRDAFLVLCGQKTATIDFTCEPFPTPRW